MPAVRTWVSLVSEPDRRGVLTVTTLAVLIYQLVKSHSGPPVAIGITPIVQQLHGLGAVVTQFEKGGGTVRLPDDPKSAAISAGFQAFCNLLNVGFYARAVETGNPTATTSSEMMAAP